MQTERGLSFAGAVARLALPLLALSLTSVGAESLTPDPSPHLRIGNETPISLYSASHALVIGVSNYHQWTPLEGVVTDIQLVEKALKDHGFSVTEVLDPTLVDLEAAMRKFVAEYGQSPENRLLIYFAGHGHTITPKYGDPLGYVVPVDAPVPTDENVGAFKAAALSMQSIESFAAQIDAKHVLFVFDSCFSGTFAKSRAGMHSISLKTTLPVRQFITAGSANQQVPDVSVFREQFINALQGEGDLNRDGYITGTELGMYLEDRVTNYSRKTQTPQFGKIRMRDLDQGDFVFAMVKPGESDSSSAAKDTLLEAEVKKRLAAERAKMAEELKREHEQRTEASKLAEPEDRNRNAAPGKKKRIHVPLNF